MLFGPFETNDSGGPGVKGGGTGGKTAAVVVTGAGTCGSGIAGSEAFDSGALLDRASLIRDCTFVTSTCHKKGTMTPVSYTMGKNKESEQRTHCALRYKVCVCVYAEQ